MSTAFSLIPGPSARLHVPDMAMGERIPRIIHQTYFTTDFPEAIQRSISQVRAQNPAWDYRFYDDRDIECFISREYGADMLSAYHQINPRYGAARADFFRYLLIFRVGGVYLDIKSTTTRPLDEALHDDDRFILCHWPNSAGEHYEGWGLHPDLATGGRGEYQQWHIMSVPGHPFLKHVIEEVLLRIRHYGVRRCGTGYLGVLRTTGPICYTQAIAPVCGEHPCRVLSGHESLGLQYGDLNSAAHCWTHRDARRTHYSRLREPVVTRTAWHKALARAAGLWASRHGSRPAQKSQ